MPSATAASRTLVADGHRRRAQQGSQGEGAQARRMAGRAVALVALAVDADQQADAQCDQEAHDQRVHEGHQPLSPLPWLASHKRSGSVTLSYSALPMQRRMSLAGTTGVLDGIQAAAVPVRRRRLRLLPYALLAPSLLFLVLFTYLPVARVLVESFYDKPHGTGAATTFVGLGNYAKVLADPAFRQAALNNLVYAVGVLVPTLVLALAFALAVQRSTRFSAVLRTVFFFPSLVPLVAAASLFFFIFLPRVGLLDYYLAKIGLQGPNWLGDSDVALWSVIGLTVWKNAGYYMLFYIAGLQNVPRDTIEAAMIDGANAWQRLRFVILPALAPTTAFVVVIALIQLLTNVDHVIVLTRGGPSNATNLLLYYIFQSAHENFEYGKAAAATLMSVAVLLAISLGSLRIMERGARGAA